MTAAFFWKMLPTEEESIFVWEVSGKDKIHLLHAGLSFKQKIPFFRTFLISSEKRERERERERERDREREREKIVFLKLKKRKGKKGEKTSWWKRSVLCQMSLKMLCCINLTDSLSSRAGLRARARLDWPKSPRFSFNQNKASLDWRLDYLFSPQRNWDLRK